MMIDYFLISFSPYDDTKSDKAYAPYRGIFFLYSYYYLLLILRLIAIFVDSSCYVRYYILYYDDFRAIMSIFAALPSRRRL